MWLIALSVSALLILLALPIFTMGETPSREKDGKIEFAYGQVGETITWSEEEQEQVIADWNLVDTGTGTVSMPVIIYKIDLMAVAISSADLVISATNKLKSLGLTQEEIDFLVNK